MVYEGWLGSVRSSSHLSSVRFNARYFEPSPLLGSINLEPISSQIERLGIDCHLCMQQYAKQEGFAVNPRRNGKVVHWYCIHAGKYNNHRQLPMDITLSHNRQD